MLGGTLCVALSYMVRASIEPKFDTVRARLLVMMLAFVQPLVRGFSRYFTWLRFQAHTGQRDSATRTSAGTQPILRAV